MARRKPKGPDVPVEDEPAPSPEGAAEDATQDDDDLHAALPWLRASEEDDPEALAIWPTSWALPAAAAAILILVFGLYFWNADTAEMTNELPVAERAATPNAPSTESIASREAAPGQVVQLASFYSRSRAERYWPMVQRRASGLADLQHSVVEGSVNGRTVYRLRATGPEAFKICDKMRSAHIACMHIGH